MSFTTSLKTRPSIVAGCGAIAALAVSLTTHGAAAASSDQKAAVNAHRTHHAYVVRRWQHARPYPLYGYAKYPPGAIVGPGYVFVPGAGILGESCDMPTSTCSNEYRDVQ
jgi:hypothetical protein